MRPGHLDGPWQVLVMAAGRGPDDPMAKHYGVSHKCLVEIAGKSMLTHVVETLLASSSVSTIGVSIENEEVLRAGLGDLADKVIFCPSADSAPASALAAMAQFEREEFLITTGDHVLLDGAMINQIIDDVMGTMSDFAVGLARDEVILRAYPNAQRTFIKLGPDRVSGCNLFACYNKKGRAVFEFWHHIEKNRKNPFKLVAAFGPLAILTYITGRLTLAKAFEIASKRIGIKIWPVILPYANAAVDVDKPQDKELVEKILAKQKSWIKRPSSDLT